MTWRRQLATYALVGVAATTPHYVVLVLLVELAHWTPELAALAGYVVGGVVSYLLNRRHTFASDRAHAEAGWRFALVAGLGFACTYVAMRGLVHGLAVPYLLAQIVTTLAVMCLTFVVNRAWTFSAS